MSGKIENINGKIVFSHADGEYELRSHPYLTSSDLENVKAELKKIIELIYYSK